MHGLISIWIGMVLLLTACSPNLASYGRAPATLTSATDTRRELLSLPPPKGKIKVAVYNFRDQTGQYKPIPNVSSFSTAVTQGSAALLVQALKDSGWFLPVEREGLQDLLTERKIIRAALEQGNGKGTSQADIPPLEMASILIEGGVVGYDTNLVTGGLGAKYFGAGGSTQYRMDQVTVALRAVDVLSGRILKTVSTTKTVSSMELSAGIFRYVSFKRLLEAEAGITTNEPIMVAVNGAIEKAVTSLIIEGIRDNLWDLADPKRWDDKVIRDYLNEAAVALDFAVVSDSPAFKRLPVKDPPGEKLSQQEN